MFTFTPKSEEEIANSKSNDLLPDGTYRFLVRDVNEKVSNAGNHMLEVSLSIYDVNKKEYNLKDYLIMTDKWSFKLRHFCEAVGLLAQYEKGSINITNCIMRRGFLELGIQKRKPKPDGSGNYPDRNYVKDYNKPDHIGQKKPVADNILIDDDIPF